MSLILPNNFVGKWAIGSNEITSQKIQQYIDQFEPDILESLLGCELYGAFMADLTPQPVTPDSVPVELRFQKIFDPFCLDIKDVDYHCAGWVCDCETEKEIKSRGIKEMLIGFLYFYWTRDDQFLNGTTGTVNNKYSNSSPVTLSKTNTYRIYNDAIMSYQAIQRYILANPDDLDYDSYKGIKKEYSTWP